MIASEARLAEGRHNWLSVRYVNVYKTPLDLDFVVNATGLPAGTYTAQVRLRTAGAGVPTVFSELTIPVTLRVE